MVTCSGGGGWQIARHSTDSPRPWPPWLTRSDPVLLNDPGTSKALTFLSMQTRELQTELCGVEVTRSPCILRCLL